MSHSEQHEYLCSILSKLVDSDLTGDELKDLASALGINIEDFYYPKNAEVLEVIEWRKQA